MEWVPLHSVPQSEKELSGRPDPAIGLESCFEASPFQVGTQFNVVHVEQKPEKHMDNEVGVSGDLRDPCRCPRC